MKKLAIILTFAIAPILLAVTLHTSGDNELVPIPAGLSIPGDAARGYEYLTTGDFIKSGVPYGYFTMMNGKNTSNYLNRTGKNATVSHAYNVITHDGVDMVVPTCMQCHSHTFEGKLVIGLGNNTMDFTDAKDVNLEARLKMMQVASPNQYNAAKAFFRSFTTSMPFIETEVRGVNPADKLAIILMAHRDPQTLVWTDDELLSIPQEVIPTDVPAWWLMKKKNAMFYSGFGRGDLGKFLMLSNLLAVSDSSEAREVGSHFNDVLAYIRSLEPPVYPHAINEIMAGYGRLVFNDHCSGCHGTYGEGGSYPNLLVPGAIIQSDSALYKGVQQEKKFIDWFNRSWFVQGSSPAYIVPFNGYIAPPLDGVWVTAPYMHNGSIPTIEAMLDSKLRPAYWSRDFDKPEYDYTAVGWKYTKHEKPEPKKTYNTTLQGYGNYGHYFGDVLTDKERSAVIEYLKTL